MNKGTTKNETQNGSKAERTYIHVQKTNMDKVRYTFQNIFSQLKYIV